jgi:hypothetical protein
MSDGMAGMGGSFFFGFSAIIASVVNRSEATDAAFWRAKRATFVGSIIPAEACRRTAQFRRRNHEFRLTPSPFPYNGASQPALAAI